MSEILNYKKQAVNEFGKNNRDTGNTSVQIAILTHRIKSITEHLKLYHNDFHSRRGLIALVSLRKSLSKYLKRKDIEGYKKLIATLGIRG